MTMMAFVSCSSRSGTPPQTPQIVGDCPAGVVQACASCCKTTIQQIKGTPAVNNWCLSSMSPTAWTWTWTQDPSDQNWGMMQLTFERAANDALKHPADLGPHRPQSTIFSIISVRPWNLEPPPMEFHHSHSLHPAPSHFSSRPTGHITSPHVWPHVVRVRTGPVGGNRTEPSEAPSSRIANNGLQSLTVTSKTFLGFGPDLPRPAGCVEDSGGPRRDRAIMV